MDKSSLDFFLNENVQIDTTQYLSSLICAAILSILIQIVYNKFSTTLSNKIDFSKNFVVLGITTTIVIMIVKNSIALSLGLVGALSIVRFRAAIKEPEELVYLFFIISIGLANGANQFLLSLISTVIIITFLFLRNYFQSKNKKNFKFNSDSNILCVNIKNNNKKKIDDIIKELSPKLRYLKLKSANIEQNKSTYIFWYDLDENQTESFLSNTKKLCDENLDLSIYSKTGAYE
mgnify:CR=1 FL=1